jgi:hypothetical protein
MQPDRSGNRGTWVKPMQPVGGFPTGYTERNLKAVAVFAAWLLGIRFLAIHAFNRAVDSSSEGRFMDSCSEKRLTLNLLRAGSCFV